MGKHGLQLARQTTTVVPASRRAIPRWLAAELSSGVTFPAAMDTRTIQATHSACVQRELIRDVHAFLYRRQKPRYMGRQLVLGFHRLNRPRIHHLRTWTSVRLVLSPHACVLSRIMMVGSRSGIQRTVKSCVTLSMLFAFVPERSRRRWRETSAICNFANLATILEWILYHTILTRPQ